MPSRATQLLELGQSVWLDFIRRELLVSGAFDRLVRDQGVVGVTSNPTIFQNALAEGHDYDESITRWVAAGLEGEPLFEALAIEDIGSVSRSVRDSPMTHRPPSRPPAATPPRSTGPT